MRDSAFKANPRKRVRFFYALSLLMLLPMASNASSERTALWLNNGAYELALSELSQKQPQPAANYPVWETWERQRFTLYESLGRWKGILEREQSLPPNTDADFRLWAGVQAVHAHLALRDFPTALASVQKQLWADISVEDLQIWRAVLVQVYAAKMDDQAAVVAWRRYKQDELQNQAQQTTTMSDLAKLEYSAALRAFAQILIREEKYSEAVRELTDDSSVDGRLLFAAGQLLVAEGSVKQIFKLSEQLAESDYANPAQKRKAYVLMSRAAGRQKQYRTRVTALVKALAIPEDAHQSISLMSATADDLWTAYEAWGLSIGLAEGLTPEYENQWAAGLDKPRSADETVALASVLVLGGRSIQNRGRATTALLAALPQLEHGAEQALWLLNDSQRLLQNYVDLPEDLQRAALRAALRVANLNAVKEFRQRRGPVADPIADQANGILDVHARLLLGEAAPASKFLNDGLENLSAWFKSSQQDLLVLLRDMEAGGYYSAVAAAGYKLATVSSDMTIRIPAAKHACNAMMKLNQHRRASLLALDILGESADAEANDLALLAYASLWKAGLKADANQLWHRRLTAPEVQEEAADLRRRLQIPSRR